MGEVRLSGLRNEWEERTWSHGCTHSARRGLQRDKTGWEASVPAPGASPWGSWSERPVSRPWHMLFPRPAVVLLRLPKVTQ